jgi:predicted phosphodiesterase
MRYLVIGDVHGNIEALEKIAILFDTVDKVIFVGDYVDRGTSSIDVLKKVLSFDDNKVIKLIGNHEFGYFKKFKNNIKKFPKEHEEKDFDIFFSLMQELKKRSYTFYKDENIGVSHAAAGLFQHDWDKIIFDKFYYGWTSGEKDENGYPIRLTLKQKYPHQISIKPVIYGHCHFANLHQNINEFCVDYDSGYGGPLCGAIFEDDKFKELFSF